MAREANPPGSSGPTGYDLLLTGGIVVTLDEDRRVLDPGAAAVTGDRIVAVGPPEELAATPSRRVVDCARKAVIPGFVDAHTHQFQGLARGLGEGMALWPWLKAFMWPYAAQIGRHEVVVAATLYAVEALKAGTTAILDDHY